MVTRLVHRAVRFLGVRVARRLRRDYVTGLAVHPRADLERLGDDYGGWVVPTSLLGPDSVVYCVGCGENISFDLTLIRRFGCQVHALDPTPRAVEFVRRTAGGETKYHFESLGLWDETTTLRFYSPKNPSHVSHSALNLQGTDSFIEVPVDRLSQVLERHGQRRVTLLKLDIEGAEYKVLDSVLTDEVPVQVVCVEYDEFHHPLDRGYRRRIRASVKKLLARGYTLVDAYSGNYTFVHSPRAPGTTG